MDGVDLEVVRGECVGLLGPNGAGKTTTIEMLEGLIAPDAGEVRILGRNWAGEGRALRQQLGVQLQETRLPDKLTVAEILRTFRSFYDRGSDAEWVLDLVGLRDKHQARTIDLSGGQRQRLALACALIGDPAILFLDEPTTGLDPHARRRIWEIIESFKARGGAVLMTTHYMDEAEKLSNDILIMDHGKVIARGSPAEIIQSLQAESIVSLRVKGKPDAADLQGLAGIRSIHIKGTQIQLSVTQAERVLPTLFSTLHDRGLALVDLHIHRPTLEDVFVTLTGRRLRDE
ncbi:MAG: ABC transporter ATP-binding protein [Gammaproteobacteria bacterium]